MHPLQDFIVAALQRHMKVGADPIPGRQAVQEISRPLHGFQGAEAHPGREAILRETVQQCRQFPGGIEIPAPT